MRHVLPLRLTIILVLVAITLLLPQGSMAALVIGHAYAAGGPFVSLLPGGK